jgi:hypothetical protein
MNSNLDIYGISQEFLEGLMKTTNNNKSGQRDYRPIIEAGTSRIPNRNVVYTRRLREEVSILYSGGNEYRSRQGNRCYE